MTKPYRIAITTGDADGIGSEITAKALAKIGPQKNVKFILWRSRRCPQKHLRMIDSKFHRQSVKSWPEVFNLINNNSSEIIDICSSRNPAHWVEVCAKAAMYNHIDAIVTSPLSKTTIIKSGYKQIGHTEIFQKVAKVKNVNMAFIGKQFNVVLATPHIALKDVEKKLTDTLIKNTFENAQMLIDQLPAKQRKKPMALVGLNPHAGEKGLIGKFESETLPAVLKQIKKKHNIEGPLVPDAAFFQDNWKKYSTYICLYHDQGLIPFKMIHGQDSGVHLTLGLPFIRTSVDHGTAKNIFGKNKANPNSMIESIDWAIKLAKRKRNKGV